MLHLTRRAWFGIVVGIVGVAALSVTIAAAQTDDAPRGTDPLSADELQVATDLAQGSGTAESGGGALGDDDVVLLVERHEENKPADDDGLRRANVYVYSYDDDVLTLSVVDTASGEVDQRETLPGTQLPLVEEEGARALDIALADPQFARVLATRYRQATGRDLADPATDLEIQPIVFRADANPSAGAAVCGRHRCAQLMIQTTDNLLVNILPIVDLSAERLVTRTGFFS